MTGCKNSEADTATGDIPEVFAAKLRSATWSGDISSNDFYIESENCKLIYVFGNGGIFAKIPLPSRKVEKGILGVMISIADKRH
jgi:hypothetical protein